VPTIFGLQAGPEMPRRILIIDDHDDMSSELRSIFEASGHVVTVYSDHDKAVSECDSNDFDLVVTDLDVIPTDDIGIGVDGRPLFRLFKISACGFTGAEASKDELKECIETVLNYKAKFLDEVATVRSLREIVEVEIPSLVELMDPTLSYLTTRVEKMGVIDASTSNLFIALDEAFANAVKHGNKSDTSKMVRIAADISGDEASFTIEDEGEGFDISSIPDPRDPINLMKASGRGVFFISSIMDEVRYNERGNRITMIKRANGEKTEG
jgi:serine/threonine-protein kinase RsbW